jgi:hypothetical protein
MNGCWWKISTATEFSNLSFYDNLVNESNLVHSLFLVYFVNFIYNFYMFGISPGPSSGATTVFMQNLVLVILYSWLSGMQDSVLPPDDGPGEVRNM